MPHPNLGFRFQGLVLGFRDEGLSGVPQQRVGLQRRDNCKGIMRNLFIYRECIERF